jgi:branched-chain amino acid transport system permease protein
MEEFVAFGIVGLSTAAIYAIIGSGLVLTYATTGVFNFAHGAAGMLAAFSYWQLTVGWGWPVPVALLVVLFILAPAFGLAVERVVLRPVQGLGETERLVMTVALLSGAIAIAQWIWNPNVARPLFPFFLTVPPIHIGLATITWHQATTMIVAVVVAIGLRILLYRTRAGAEMRATVDDRGLVGLTGADPLRANRLAWILGTQLAAIGGILIAPAVALDAAQLSMLIVSAYTAAIFGRLRSIPLTFVGAIVVGCMESYLAGYLPQNPYLPGLRIAAPALLLFVSLLLFPHGRLRGRVRRLTRVPAPTARGTALFAVATVVFGLVLASVLGKADLITYGAIFSLGIVALSYVPLAGYAGQVSLCQLSIAGIGAVTWAHLGSHGEPWALVAAMGVSAAVGALIAIPALRLSGVYLALGTAAFAVVLDRWIFTLPTLHVFGVQIALFDQSSVSTVGPRLFGLSLEDGRSLMVLAAVGLALASIAIAWLRRSRFGRALIALRDSEAAYATLGGNLLWTKVAVFALSAAIAGLGGAIYGMQQRSIIAIQFSFVAGLPLFLVAVIGGLGAIGNGLFTGTAYFGPLNLLVRVAPWASSLVAILPGLAGIGLGRNPDGIVARLRESWAPVGRDRLVAPVLFAGLALAWVLRLGNVINGWAFLVAAAVLALAAQGYATARQAGPRVRDVPLEWWGVRRAWRQEDREVLDRGVAAG